VPRKAPAKPGNGRGTAWREERHRGTEPLPGAGGARPSSPSRCPTTTRRPLVVGQALSARVAGEEDREADRRLLFCSSALHSLPLHLTAVSPHAIRGHADCPRRGTETMPSQRPQAECPTAGGWFVRSRVRPRSRDPSREATAHRLALALSTIHLPADQPPHLASPAQPFLPGTRVRRLAGWRSGVAGPGGVESGATHVIPPRPQQSRRGIVSGFGRRRYRC
jgi:hypothetical protein